MSRRMRGIGSNQWKHIISTISNITSHSLETHLLVNRYVTNEYDGRACIIEAFVPSPMIHLSNDSGQI